MGKEGDNQPQSQPQEQSRRQPDSVWLDVKYNRMQRMMQGVTWSEQYGDPIEALAKVEAVDVELMSPEDRSEWQKRLARRL